MIDRAPKVVTFTVDLYVHLIKVPLPMPEPFHPAHSLVANISSSKRITSGEELKGLAAGLEICAA